LNNPSKSYYLFINNWKKSY